MSGGYWIGIGFGEHTSVMSNNLKAILLFVACIILGILGFTGGGFLLWFGSVVCLIVGVRILQGRNWRSGKKDDEDNNKILR